MSKDKTIRARISSEDYDTFTKRVKQSGLSKSEFLRQCATRSTIKDMEPLKKIYFELKKEGSNLNQLVRKLHQNENLSENKILSEINQLMTLQYQLKDLIKGEIHGFD